MKKVMEDFVCEVCGEKVIGNGVTDHCPKCLWGKHVDEEVPGDRASMCKGLMQPIRSEYRNGIFRNVRGVIMSFGYMREKETIEI